jgi:G:T-mismatch repair DNA endonuclease (very short patch repair protein)
MPKASQRRFSRQKLLKARRRRKATVSSIEVLVQGWLKRAGIPFQPQYAIGLCHVDLFVPPSLVVEVQGCFFHSCSACQLKKTKQNKGVVGRDRRRFAFIAKCGYTVLELWEHDLEEANEAAVVERIRRERARLTGRA